MLKQTFSFMSACAFGLLLCIGTPAPADAAAVDGVHTRNADAAIYQGETIWLSLPVLAEPQLQDMQNFFCANAAKSLYAYMPYYSDDYGRANPFYLQDTYKPADITVIAKTADLLHRRQNKAAAAQGEFSNRYAMTADYEVKLDNSDYISVLQSIYTYSGGAHGMTVRFSMTADKATGKALVLSDLFASPDYLTELNKLAAEQNKDIHFFNPVHLSGNEEFYLTDKGLTVYFQLYEVAPYAAGFIEYFFPYDVIAPLLSGKIA